jgi:16S rRNA (guanine527-N7)-methyltransferase
MPNHTFSYDELLKYKNVPRETFLLLEEYCSLLEKWQNKINLIATSTLPYIWQRHIIDSIQLVDRILPGSCIIDMGSGAGFPGLILAILGIKNISLVESDKRKTLFLQEAARITNAQVTIIHDRIENVIIPKNALLIARGFASILNILNTLETTLNSSNNLLLLKGKNYLLELQEALAVWSFDYTVTPSITEAQSAIIYITNPSKKGANL